MTQVIHELKSQALALPTSPGVYYFRDAKSRILYIGKSKDLRRRVSSYFHAGEKHPKIEQFLQETRSIDFTVTDTHLEARLLECAEIKRHQAIYNRQFKHERNFISYGLHATGRVLRPVPDTTEDPLFRMPVSYQVEHALLSLERLYPLGGELTYKLFPKRLSEREQEQTMQFLTEIFQSRAAFVAFERAVEDLMMAFAQDMSFERAQEMKLLGQSLAVLRRSTFDLWTIFEGASEYSIPTKQGTKSFILDGTHIIYTYKDGDVTSAESFEMAEYSATHAYENRLILYSEFKQLCVAKQLACPWPRCVLV